MGDTSSAKPGCTLNRCAHAAAASPALRKMVPGREVPYWVCVVGGIAAATLAGYFMWYSYGDDEEDLGSGFGSSHGKRTRDKRLEKEQEEENNNNNEQQQQKENGKKVDQKAAKKGEEEDDDDDFDFDFSPLTKFEHDHSRLEKSAQELKIQYAKATEKQQDASKITHEFHVLDEQITHTLIKMDGVNVAGNEKDRLRRKKLIQDFQTLSSILQQYYKK